MGLAAQHASPTWGVRMRADRLVIRVDAEMQRGVGHRRNGRDASCDDRRRGGEQCDGVGFV
eukprot:2126758-Rhodomonas_salina.1